METALNPYLGQLIAAFLADHGDFSSTVKLSDTESAFRWVIMGQGIGAVIPVGGSLSVAPPTQRVSTVTFEATTQSSLPEPKGWTTQGWIGRGPAKEFQRSAITCRIQPGLSKMPTGMVAAMRQ